MAKKNEGSDKIFILLANPSWNRLFPCFYDAFNLNFFSGTIHGLTAIDKRFLKQIEELDFILMKEIEKYILIQYLLISWRLLRKKVCRSADCSFISLLGKRSLRQALPRKWESKRVYNW